MSVENVRRFYETIATDNELRNRILEASKDYSLASVKNEDLESLMAEEFLPLLKEEGFEFGIDELTEYQRQLNIKLSRDKYKYVSGGTSKSDIIRDFFKRILY